MRKRIYEIVELREHDKLSVVYNFWVWLSIFISIIPLWSHEETNLFQVIEQVTTVVFIIDYILRLITADIRLKRGYWSFIIYPFTVMAIIDILSILPSIALLPRGYKKLMEYRYLRVLKALRICKALRYSDNMAVIVNVFQKKKDSLLAVVGLALAYIMISALVIFNAEPETFETMYDALYWATISLTTVGYGDMFATSDIGRFITMISAFLGVAIIALPSGIIMTGYQEEINELYRKKNLQAEPIDELSNPLKMD